MDFIFVKMDFIFVKMDFIFVKMDFIFGLLHKMEYVLLNTTIQTQFYQK